jgi:hypothetical protein
MAITDITIEGSGIRITTSDNTVYQGIFNFSGGALNINGIPDNIINELVYNTRVNNNVNKYSKYLLGEIKFGLALCR